LVIVFRNNYESLFHIEDVTIDTDFDGAEIPYRLSEFQKVFSGIPTDNLYWDPWENGSYLIDNGKGLMFYFNQGDIYYPANPIAATETYYRHLIMWENKQYDLLFPDVPEDFQIHWFEIAIKNDMPLKMIYPIYSQLTYGDINKFHEDIINLIEQSKNIQ
jgi:Asp-tRNA(Asn)/Glu-tRNA(Gln) amidotransferase B subunit